MSQKTHSSWRSAPRKVFIFNRRRCYHYAYNLYDLSYIIWYDLNIFSSENGYFEFLNECIKECPEETYYLDSFCLRECPHGHTYDHDDLNRGVCKKCSETGCPKTCFGVHHSKWLPAVQDLTGPNNETESGNIWHQTVNSVNIHIFKDCEVVVGSLVFQVHTFGDESPIPRLTRDDLEPLRKIKRIMGYLRNVFFQNLFKKKIITFHFS